MKENLGFIGMGLMGVPMTQNLLKAGYSVIVYNRNREKAEAMKQYGATVADSPAQVGMEAEIIIACLADAPAVEAVVSGLNGVAETISAGKVFVDMTTNSPPVTIALAKILAEKGAEMLDAPVSGGDEGARKGTLSIMAGGKPSVFQRCLPLFEVMGSRITLIGENVGDGGYAKLANQIMVPIHLAAMGEALVFGAKAGLDLEKLAQALSGGLAQSAAFDVKLPKVFSGDFTPGGKCSVQLKDLSYVAQCMEAFKIELPVTRLITQLYQQLVKEGHANEDHSAIIRLAEKAAGIEARKR